MDERNDPLAPAVRQWAEEARPQAGEHPDAERLAACAGDALDPAAAERLRDHLALCRECSRRVLELRAFPTPAPDVPALSPLEVEREWQRLWQRVAPQTGGMLAPAAWEAPRRRARWPPWMPWALAAGLLVTTLGASGWVIALQRRLEGRPGPRTDAVLVERTAAGGTTRGEPMVARSASPLVVAVAAAARGDEGGFRWEVVAPDGRRVWSGPPQPRPADDRFVLQLPARFLAPGEYRLRLTARGPGGLRELADYGLRIRP